MHRGTPRCCTRVSDAASSPTRRWARNWHATAARRRNPIIAPWDSAAVAGHQRAAQSPPATALCGSPSASP
eukprot:3889402-Pleurochrysis_carterae.AAC.1